MGQISTDDRPRKWVSFQPTLTGNKNVNSDLLGDAYEYLVGTDLSKDAYYAINEDGSDYDDDVGGPAYAAGRDGIDLAPISAEQDAAAKQAAQGLFEQIQRAAAVEPRR